MALEIAVAAIKIFIVVNVVQLAVAYTIYVERKVIAHVQMRLGPMRVGWHGLLQPIADGLKLFLKEDIIPDKSDRIVFVLAPVMVLVPALVVYAVLPFSATFYITQINIGVFFILAISSLGVFGIVMAGWASNSKYSLLGALRSAAQMLSYEIFLGFSVIGPLMLAGSMNLQEIVHAQSDVWFVFYQPIAFIVFFIAAMAETNRAPFDLPEAETELVAGFHTEYSGMKFAFFFLAEYANMFVVSTVGIVLFFGGWEGPDFIPLPGFVWYVLKLSVFMFVFIWLRATLPRYRYDQLMRVGWKFMFPLVMINIFLTGFLKYLFL